jgi:hypothetical protein
VVPTHVKPSVELLMCALDHQAAPFTNFCVVLEQFE